MEETKYIISPLTRRRIKDQTNNKFGRLTVVELDTYRTIYQATKGKYIYWLCRCDCGNETLKSVSINMLRSGDTKSCGCLQKEAVKNKLMKDLTGIRFGQLVAIEENIEHAIEKNKGKKRSRIYWKCKCDCGKYTTVESSCLTSGNTQSCGHVREGFIRNLHKQKAIEGYSIGNYIVNELCSGDSTKFSKWWDFERNDLLKLNPYEITPFSKIKIWIKCQEKDYHESYQVSCDDFSRGSRCPYCHSVKIHPKDSFAQWGVDNVDTDFLEKYWDYSKNGKIDPWSIGFGSAKNNIWIICNEKGNHGSYKTKPNYFTRGSRCPKCCTSKGEKYIDNYFKSNKINNIMQYEYSDLRGLGGLLLRFDFAIFDNNNNLKLLLEYDGEFHYLPIMGQANLDKQQEHDRRKDEYCKLHNIDLLRIPYWDFNNIETILNNKLKSI